MSPETRRVLTDVRALIENPANWVQGFYACNADGVDVWPTDSTAVCWCLDGAIRRVVGDVSAPYHAAVDALRQYTAVGIIDYNDIHGHADVLALLDRVLSEGATP